VKDRIVREFTVREGDGGGEGIDLDDGVAALGGFFGGDGTYADAYADSRGHGSLVGEI
jgi:hypothetical protein